MGNSEETKSSKSEKSSSPAPEQTNIHVYPDWAAMQAYYGSRVAVPPYYNSAVASGHPPHPYMWGPPQTMVPPYGTPYAALYAPGGVYAHPGVPLGSHAISPSPVVTEAMAVVPLSMEAPAKSPKANADQGFVNKLKGFDGLAMSIGNGNSNGDRTDTGTDNGVSQSEDTEGSSDGSDGNTTRGVQNNKKRSREGSNYAREGKSAAPKSPIRTGDANGTSSKVMSMVVAPGSDTEKGTRAVLSPTMTTSLELRNSSSSGGNLKSNPVGEAWLQNERELKRERRKQSNRESARRSRLRKQAETEELAKKVQALTAENLTLRSEINKLTESCEKLKLENSTMVEKLKTPRLAPTADLSLNNFEEIRLQQPVGTANLLARVNNSGSADREEEGEMFENKTTSGAKLRQLLDASPRADAVAAG